MCVLCVYLTGVGSANINHVGSIAENRAAATEEITAAIEDISKKCEVLVEHTRLTY